MLVAVEVQATALQWICDMSDIKNVGHFISSSCMFFSLLHVKMIVR